MIRKITIMTIVTMVIAISLNAQESPKKYSVSEARITTITKNILMGLRSGNKGVIEASLILIAKIKMNFPQTNITKIKNVIDSIAFSSSNDTLRYKAYLTSNICADPEWFSTESTLQQVSEDVFFISASQRLQNKLFGISTF